MKLERRSSKRRTRLPVVRAVGWAIDARLVRFRVADPRGPSGGCTACCCRSGVYVSLAERERILAHAAAVQRCMDAGQVRDPAEWFERRVYRDPDFEGGRCVGTRVMGAACVFLNGRGLCTLQLASARSGIPQLKPFYCRIFPLTLADGVVVYHPFCKGRAPCCTFGRTGAALALEACRPEFEEVLGAGGYRALVELAQRRAGNREYRDRDAPRTRAVELR